jgi:hypothetical protein
MKFCPVLLFQYAILEDVMPCFNVSSRVWKILIPIANRPFLWAIRIILNKVINQAKLAFRLPFETEPSEALLKLNAIALLPQVCQILICSFLVRFGHFAADLMNPLLVGIEKRSKRALHFSSNSYQHARCRDNAALTNSARDLPQSRKYCRRRKSLSSGTTGDGVPV